MEENSIKNERSSIKEDIERLKLCSTNQCNICGRYEKEECMLERNRCEQHILSDYKRILKENERYQKSDYETICLENNQLREITDRIQSEYNDLLKDNFKLKDELEAKRKEYQETYKDVREELRELKKENEELKIIKSAIQTLQINSMEDEKYIVISKSSFLDGSYKHLLDDYIPKQKVKDIIDRIDYDIKKTKEIISKNTNIYASYRKNDYQIVRLRAMNTKSLDIKKRLQELLESEEINERKRI